MDNRYKQGKIYKIICSETGDVYYGSTIKTLIRRFDAHNNKGNDCASKNFVNPMIELVELYPCNSKLELRKREQYFIDNNECVNIIKSYISEEDRKERDNKNRKRYYEDTREKQLEFMKKYHQDNKEKRNEYTRQYRLDNKEKIIEHDRLRNLNAKIIECKCGSKFSERNKSTHEKSKKHLNFVNNNINGKMV